MKQRSSSFQISDILGLPPKENSSSDDTHGHTSIPPASISSALHSSNNPYLTMLGYPTPTHNVPPSIANDSPKTPALSNLNCTGPSCSLLMQQPSPLDRPPLPPALLAAAPNSGHPIDHHLNSLPPPPGHHHHLYPPQGLIDSKTPTGGYLPGNLNSSMFLESSAAAAAHHYNNLFHQRWHMDNNSNDHYGEYRTSV